MIIGYVLLALGIAVFVLSFILPARSEDEKSAELSEDMIRDMVNKEVESAKGRITDIVDETVNYAIEKSERSMDRLTNEKMMAVNEYSDTVLSEINKNHQEVVFLYDMLNDKHENLKDTVASVEKTASEVKQAVKDAELTVMEAEQISKAAKESKIPEPSYVPEPSFEPIPDLEPEPEPEPEILPEIQFEELTDIPEVPAISEDIIPEPIGMSEDDPSYEMSGQDILNEIRETEEEKPAKPAPSGRMSAIDRLKAVAAEKEDFKPIIIERADPDEEVGKKPKRKKTTKVKTDAEDELKSYVQNVKRTEGPDLNLGDNPVRKGFGRNNNDRILELHEMGKSNMAIAKELGLGIGEVKLVIDLFEGK